MQAIARIQIIKVLLFKYIYRNNQFVSITITDEVFMLSEKFICWFKISLAMDINSQTPTLSLILARKLFVTEI